ncbi:MAG: sel1 repeat family protein, partial [Porticoccaceae bacterium]|nr:sel1 repeat family protein [Porticoccaceae bacterium]
MEFDDEILELAQKGDADAQYNLALMYRHGKGVPENDAEAVRWYRKAAEQGYAKAQNNLAWMYANGKGVPRDETEAARWYRKSAEQGDADAQYNLALMYYDGEGVSKNKTKAYLWYSLAAAQGHEDAKTNLEILKDDGTKEQIAKAQALAPFEIALNEVESNNVDSALWAEAYAHTEDEESRKKHYVRERAKVITSEAGSELRSLGKSGWGFVIAFVFISFLMLVGLIETLGESGYYAAYLTNEKT